jgi:hypothetical protein
MVDRRGHDQWVGILFRAHDDRPVFHALDYATVGTEDEATICGLATWNGYREVGLSLPLKHATVIGRPCRRCYSPAAGEGNR